MSPLRHINYRYKMSLNKEQRCVSWSLILNFGYWVIAFHTSIINKHGHQWKH